MSNIPELCDQNHIDQIEFYCKKFNQGVCLECYSKFLKDDIECEPINTLFMEKLSSLKILWHEGKQKIEEISLKCDYLQSVYIK